MTGYVKDAYIISRATQGMLPIVASFAGGRPTPVFTPSGPP
jgi:hypothetical protein